MKILIKNIVDYFFCREKFFVNSKIKSTSKEKVRFRQIFCEYRAAKLPGLVTRWQHLTSSVGFEYFAENWNLKHKKFNHETKFEMQIELPYSILQHFFTKKKTETLKVKYVGNKCTID